MTYAPTNRAYYNADSHVMEFPDFIIDYADEEFKDLIPPVSYEASLVTDEEVAVIVANGNKHSEAHVAEQIALGDELIAKSKEIQALGAFDCADRSVAMDMLGFKKQLVFATHSVVTPFHPSSKVKPELRDVGRFERSLGDRSEGIRTSFYTENFRRIFPDARV